MKRMIERKLKTSEKTMPRWCAGQTERFQGSGASLVLCRGVAKLVKASDFDSDMRGFESFLPCQTSAASVLPFPPS